MKRLFTKKISRVLLFLWVGLTLFSIAIPATVKPAPAYADLKCGAEFLNELGGKSAARKALADTITITVKNAGTLHVEVGLDKRLFSDSGLSSLTFKDAYSADYSWGKDPDGNSGFVYAGVDTGVKLSNDDPATAFGFIRSGKSVPKADASQKDIDEWAQSLEVYFGIFRKTGHASADQYYYFIDEQDNGDSGDDGWQCFLNSLGEDFAPTDHGSYHGISTKEDGIYAAGRVVTGNVNVRYIYQESVIIAPESDNIKKTSYSLGTASSSPKNFFKQEGGNGIIYSDDWDNKTPEQIKALFEVKDNVQTTLHKGNDVTTIYVAGSLTDAAVTNAADVALKGGNEDSTVECESAGGNLSWVICPIVNGSLDGAQAIFRSFVQPYLQTDPVTTAPDNPVFVIWKAFRTIGNIVLVFALLFVVFGQSIGGGLVDAYTAKKTVPRILIAAILLNLSIYICAVLVDIFNVLGSGISKLIVAPLQESDLFKFRPAGLSADIAGIGAILAIIGGGYLFHLLRKGESTNNTGSLGTVLGYVLLFIVVPILLAVFGVFLTLIIRRAIILLLIIISPVAMALFAVPNADKYAKKWLDAFIKTLMVYPIITAIFGISQVLAVITFNAGGDDNALTSIVTLVATLIIAFAPLFMIPFAFKLAGGVIGGLSNTVRSGRDNLKKMWGDDKHNPHSARVRMAGKARENTRGRIISGAGGTNSRVLRRLSTMRAQNDTIRKNNAADTASTTGRGAVSNTNATPEQVNEGERLAMDAAKGTVASFPVTGKGKFTGKEVDSRAQWVAGAATDGYINHGFNRQTSGAAAAAARTSAMDPDATEAEVRFAGSTAAEAAATMNASAGEAEAVGVAMGAYHRANGGNSPATAADHQAIMTSALASHRSMGRKGWSNLQTRAANKAASIGTGRALQSANVDVRNNAQSIGQGAAVGAAAASKIATDRGLKNEKRRAVEAASADASMDTAIQALSNPAYNREEVHEAAAIGAADALIDGGARAQASQRAGAASAQVIAGTTGPIDDVTMARARDTGRQTN